MSKYIKRKNQSTFAVDFLKKKKTSRFLRLLKGKLSPYNPRS